MKNKIQLGALLLTALVAADIGCSAGLNESEASTDGDGRAVTSEEGQDVRLDALDRGATTTTGGATTTTGGATTTTSGAGGAGTTGPLAGATTSVLQAGVGWQRLQVQGTLADADTGATHAANDEVVVIRGVRSIDASPLGPKAKAALHADTRATAVSGADEDDDTIYFVHRPTADALEAPPPANAPTIRAFSSCDNYDKTYDKQVSGSQSYTHHLGTQSDGFTGTADISGQVSGNADASVMLRIKRVQTYIFGCQTYAAAFKNVEVKGSASAQGRFQVNGKYEHAWHYSKEVVKPSLGSADFWVGPLPVHIGFNLPVDVGFDASAVATVNADASAHANATFDITCTKSSCDGSKSIDFGIANNKAPTASVSARAEVTPFVEASVRAYLYSESIAYAQVGVKPKLPTELFYYYGNQCGDANGDGVNEYVSALTFDLGIAADVDAKVSLLGSDVWSHDWNLIGRRTLGFWDLMPGGSTALVPILHGTNGALSAGQTPSGSFSAARVQAGMRPCWPYTDPLNYQLAWGDGVTENVTLAAGQTFVHEHAYGSRSVQTVTATTVNDNAGRTIQKSNTVQVVPHYILANNGGVLENSGGGGLETSRN